MKRRGLRSHVLYAEGSESAVADYAASVPNANGIIRVHVTSTFTKAETAAAMESHKVEKNRFLRLVRWLEKHNTQYSDVVIDAGAVEDLPDCGLLSGAFVDATGKPNHRFARSVPVMYTQPSGVEADGVVVGRSGTDVTIRFKGTGVTQTVPMETLIPISELAVRPSTPPEMACESTTPKTRGKISSSVDTELYAIADVTILHQTIHQRSARMEKIPVLLLMSACFGAAMQMLMCPIANILVWMSRIGESLKNPLSSMWTRWSRTLVG